LHHRQVAREERFVSKRESGCNDRAGRLDGAVLRQPLAVHVSASASRNSELQLEERREHGADRWHSAFEQRDGDGDGGEPTREVGRAVEWVDGHIDAARTPPPSSANTATPGESRASTSRMAASDRRSVAV